MPQASSQPQALLETRQVGIARLYAGVCGSGSGGVHAAHACCKGTVAFAPCAACVLRSSAQCGTRVLLWERCVPTLGHQRHREWDMGGQEGQQR